MPGIKKGNLVRMMDAITSGDRRVKVSHIIQYIDSNVVADTALDNVKLPFESPLPTFVVANEELKAELAPDKKTGDSALRRAVMAGCPARVVAALCQLGPDALQCPDHKGRVVLHLACLLPASEPTNQVLTVLLKAHPLALLNRDEGGRTPLHYLCWFHGAQRTPDIVAAFCVRLPKTKFYGLKQAVDADKKHPLPEIPRPQERIPNSAAILPDSKHGCLALHYAVANQCSPAVLTVLLQVFPLSKHITDRYGRTALHWYLGAGHSGCTTHVSGEDKNPHEAPWWLRPMEEEVLTLLLSSRVARTTDRLGRHVLHWTAEKVAMSLYHSQNSDVVKVSPTLSSDIKSIRSHFTGQIVGQDVHGQTPIMVLFDTIQKCQKELGVRMVNPSVEILRLFLEHPDITQKNVPAALEDESGRLPLHAAVEIGANHEAISLIVQQHPTALVHTSETYQAPLHAAFSKLSASLQTTDVLEVLLQTYTAGSQETVVVDGRIALKLEDINGSYPIHYAAENQASLAVLQLLVRSFPPVCLQQRSDGNLPIHCLVRPSMIQYLTSPAASSDGTSADKIHSEEDFLLDRKKLQIFYPFLLQETEKLRVQGSASQMTALHIAVLFQVVDRLSMLRMLRAYPDAALLFSSTPDFSVLDLHEFTKQRWLTVESEWQLVREMLFAFVPTLASHRHRQELLGRCVRIVIDEVNQSGDRPHFLSTGILDKEGHKRPNLQISHTLSAAEARARMHLKIRTPRKKATKPKQDAKATKDPKASRKPQRRGKNILAMKSSESGTKELNVSSSIYDEDNTHFDYEVSSGSFSEDDDDDSYFSDEYDDEDESGTDGEEDEGSYTDDGDGQELTLDRSTYTSDADYHTDYNSFLTGPSSQFDSFGNTLSYERSVSFDDAHRGTTSGPSTSFESNVPPSLRRTKHGLVVEMPSDPDAFDKAQKSMEEEKKEEDDRENQGAQDTSKALSTRTRRYPWEDRPDFLSDVGMRLWTFFAMFSDAGNPNDNYVDKMSAIFDEVPFARVEALTLLKLPSYASLYVGENSLNAGGPNATFRDIANPKCRELIHKTCYFVGKYDFSAMNRKEILVHRHPTGRFVVVRAFEWHFTTQESTDAINPGVSEAEIWKTGEIPAEVGLTFRSQKRAVFMKFTSDPDEYRDEVSARQLLGDNHVIMPLLAKYCADASGSRDDRTYRTDINDVRFNRLDLGDGGVVRLENFPYALVYPEYTSLLDIYRHRGFDSDMERKKVCSDIGFALSNLHARNIIHGGVSLSKIVRLREGHPSRPWVLSDCVGSAFTGDSLSNTLGRVSQKGNLLTTQMTAPPDHLVKATPAQLRHYRKYWTIVQKQAGITLDKRIEEPYVNPMTGETYFFRFHYQNSNDDLHLPQPPYSLHYASTSADLWAFGLLIFEIFAGRPLIPYDEKSASLLDYSILANWDERKAKALIYDYVKDPLAQDLLILLLAKEETRKSLQVKDVLKHPLFLPPGTKSPEADAIVDRRRMDTAAHKRSLQYLLEKTSEKEWLESRSISLNCWDAVILEKFLVTPTDIVKHLSGSKSSIALPCTNLLLPYCLVPDNKGLLRPKDEMHVEKAERLGAALLQLSKACRCGAILRRKVREMPAQTKWTSSTFFELLSDSYFDDIKDDLSEMASSLVESFRDDPLSIVTKLIQDRIIDILSFYADDDMDVYFYLVDEYRCLPLVDTPIILKATSDDMRSEVILCSILSMQMTALYSLHQMENAEGLMQLLNESGKKEIPDSWSRALPLRPIKNALDAIVQDLLVLQEAFSSLEVSHESSGSTHRRSLHPDGDLRVLRYLIEDRLSDWGELYRVAVPDGDNNDCCLWTKGEVADSLRQRSKQSSWRQWVSQQRGQV